MTRAHKYTIAVIHQWYLFGFNEERETYGMYEFMMAHVCVFVSMCWTEGVCMCLWSFPSNMITQEVKLTVLKLVTWITLLFLGMVKAYTVWHHQGQNSKILFTRYPQIGSFWAKCDTLYGEVHNKRKKAIEFTYQLTLMVLIPVGPPSPPPGFKANPTSWNRTLLVLITLNPVVCMSSYTLNFKCLCFSPNPQGFSTTYHCLQPPSFFSKSPDFQVKQF